jgi:hypothetical protein
VTTNRPGGVGAPARLFLCAKGTLFPSGEKPTKPVGLPARTIVTSRVDMQTAYALKMQNRSSASSLGGLPCLGAVHHNSMSIQ